MKTKKLTIAQIAQLAGVSKATVSRVLNDYPHIRPEVRERVQRVIDDTGYERNSIARLLATDKSNMIGLVVPSGAKAIFTDPYFPQLTQGISQTVNQVELTLALFIFHSEQEGESMINRILANGMLDGLIVTSDRKETIIETHLLNSDMPFVVIGRPETNREKITYIDTDNIAGGNIATTYLIEKGYRRIAMIGSNKNTSGDDRFRGYQQALTAHGMTLDDSLVAFGDYSLESGEVAMRQLLPAQPDAVFVASDTMALGAMRTIRECQLRVPDDIAVMGYDDLPPAIQADPPLTTIRQPIEQTGQYAVKHLMELIANPDKTPEHIFLPNQLIIRGSA